MSTAHGTRTDSTTHGAATWGWRERLTTAWAVVRLEWWLEWFGAPWRSCRAHRQELAANLRAAHEDGPGVVEGLRRVGDLRELARAAAEGPRRLRWERGLVVASLVLAVALLVQLVLVLTYAGGLLAAGGGDGWVLGAPVSATGSDGSVAVAFTVPWTPLLLAGAAFVLASRPWRVLTRA